MGLFGILLTRGWFDFGVCLSDLGLRCDGCFPLCMNVVLLLVLMIL